MDEEGITNLDSLVKVTMLKYRKYKVGNIMLPWHRVYQNYYSDQIINLS